MHFTTTFFSLLLATMASTTAIPEANTNDIIARFPSALVSSDAALVDRSAELTARACNCGSAFSCSKSVKECCKSTGGYGMCKTDIRKCKCGTQCNPLQCKW
ncbi:hypothetical protein DPSP01_003069 [Paraphaeosphaeria sporulosa]|uniref:Uncharacterized protein n=1 Tax=Paraphaeosphaeria sporulosa TaxID=1460663 RepID=A0A177CMS7_9PLEO|nr:uncharacterized protein CC84DRAFT_1203549 [Paraphaeosphaeria sporulosa]OAG08067.1 hypothetical protein CC84DRAFT_1203549 [Paraphaeosphaeria sporulosa]